MPNPFLLFWSRGEQAEKSNKNPIEEKNKIPNEGAFGAGFWGRGIFLGFEKNATRDVFLRTGSEFTGFFLKMSPQTFRCDNSLLGKESPQDL